VKQRYRRRIRLHTGMTTCISVWKANYFFISLIGVFTCSVYNLLLQSHTDLN